jgi:predicted nucleotidyltransferase
MGQASIEQRFTAALASLVEQVKEDRSILGAVLCGSLSHDTVWAKSDIDLVFVTVDDRKVEAGDKALYADGEIVHALLIPRAQFRKMVESSVRNSFLHSFLLKGRLLYTHDPTIADLYAELTGIGERDTQLQLLQAATYALPSIYKARKWLLTRGDLDYTALWILYAATPLARIEVVGRHILADREVVLQALAVNPAFFTIIYTDLLNQKKTRKSVEEALEAAEGYLAGRAATLFAPLLEYLREAGEARSAGEIEDHFKRQFNVQGVTTACEYLADQGLVGKASTPVRMTKKSNLDVQELAFFSHQS